jgi:hypothetical protein
LRKAIAFSSRRLAASKSSQLANVLVVELRQIITGGLQPAVGLLSPFLKHIVLGVMVAGTMQFGGVSR